MNKRKALSAIRAAVKLVRNNHPPDYEAALAKMDIAIEHLKDNRKPRTTAEEISGILAKGTKKKPKKAAEKQAQPKAVTIKVASPEAVRLMRVFYCGIREIHVYLDTEPERTGMQWVQWWRDVTGHTVHDCLKLQMLRQRLGSLDEFLEYAYSNAPVAQSRVAYQCVSFGEPTLLMRTALEHEFPKQPTIYVDSIVREPMQLDDDPMAWRKWFHEVTGANYSDTGVLAILRRKFEKCQEFASHFFYLPPGVYVSESGKDNAC